MICHIEFIAQFEHTLSELRLGGSTIFWKEFKSNDISIRFSQGVDINSI